jgi:putative flavoprotein involved in K+ transport
MTLVGRTERFRDGVLYFATGLKKNLEKGDADYLSVLDAADAYVARNGLDLPAESGARVFDAHPECVRDPMREMDLVEAGVTSVIWATGYDVDYSWLKVDAFDKQGRPNHQRGVSTEPGIYFLGLPWLSRRGSSFIWGVWHDARYLAHHVSTHHGYMAHHASVHG